MTDKSFLGGMMLVGIIIFLTICMIIQSCPADYVLEKYLDDKGNQLSVCCHESSSGYDAAKDECTGAQDELLEPMVQKDLLENIKLTSPQAYFIIIVILMGLAVLGAVLMIG